MNLHDECPIPKLCLEHRKLEFEMQDERGLRTLKFSLIIAALLFFAFSLASKAFAKTVRYELTVNRQNVNLSGKKEVDFALTVNGGIPAPTLEFTEGDDAEIKVINNTPNEEVSIHWHGILLPPEEDGVAYVNTPPIFPGKSHTFRFKIRQHGTYWYHSHTGVQEQKGVYGALVIHPKKKTIQYDKDVVVVLSDWSDENADQILRNLKKDGDYYLHKKDTVRSWAGAIKAGAVGTYLNNEWTRMGGMDLSDVGYDAFLINGKRDSQLATVHPGDRVRLRIINAGASSYFYVSLGQDPMKVISADGVDIESTYAKEILIGMAETYDVLFTVPEHKNFELRATCQDGTGYASGWIGMGPKVSAPTRPMPNMYAPMDHGAHGSIDHSKIDHSQHKTEPETNEEDEHAEHHIDHSAHGAHSEHDKIPTPQKEKPLKVIETLTVDELKAPSSTALPKNKKIHDLKLVLGGDMERYIWHINGKAIHEDRTIEINESDIVRFTYENETMMHHPMHLHGHFFRVLNKHGSHSPLKHTVDVPPHGTRTIEFYANEPGQWMLHCHNLYHMKTGMARVVKYTSFTPKPEMAAHEKHDPHLHDHWYKYGSVEVASNHAEAFFRISQTWNQIEARVEGANTAGKNFSFSEGWDYEADLFYRRWTSNYFNIVGGATSFGKEITGVLGIGYILPMLIETNVLVNHKGKFRIDIEKKFQWTKTIFSEAEFTWRPNQNGAHTAEFEVTLMYSPAWSWAAGAMLTNDSLGAGAQFQF